MKRVGFLSLGAVLLTAIGTFAACSDDEPDQLGSSSSGDGGGGGSDATTSSSSSSGSADCTEAVDPACNTAKCTADLGQKAICVAGQCKALATEVPEDCAAADIFGAVDDERAIWIGGATAMIAAGGKINPSGPPRRNSMQLAVDEINTIGGIPGPGGANCNRKLAAIVCDDGAGRNTSGTTDVTERIGHHLVDDLGIKAIVGGGTSGPTIALATKVTVSANALLIAPSATAIAISDLVANAPSGERLMWRTAPSDLLQSQALLKLYDAYVAAHPGAQKLAIVDKGDAYGKGLADAFQGAASLNGNPIPGGGTDGGAGDGGAASSDFYRGTCSAGTGLSDAGTSLCQDQVDGLLALHPTIIVLAGTSEQITQIMIPYETANAGVKPFYFVPDGPAKQELFDYAKTNPDIAKRVQGTVPGAVTDLANNFFNLSYKLKFPTSPDKDNVQQPSTLLFGMAGSYDAVYLLTYAMASANTGAKTFTGADYARGLAKMTAGTGVDVGVANYPTAIGALTGGQSIDFNGASGPLNFDVAKGEAPSDMIIWCLRKDPNTGNYQRFDDTHQKYDSVAGELEGDYLCPE